MLYELHNFLKLNIISSGCLWQQLCVIKASCCHFFCLPFSISLLLLLPFFSSLNTSLPLFETTPPLLVSSRPPLLPRLSFPSTLKSWRNYGTHNQHFLHVFVFSLHHRTKANGKNALPSRARLCLCIFVCVFSLSRPTEKVPMTTKYGDGCLSRLYKTGQNKGRKSIWRMAELLLRKPGEEGIPPSPFSGLKMTLTHGRSAKTYEFI